MRISWDYVSGATSYNIYYASSTSYEPVLLSSNIAIWHYNDDIDGEILAITGLEASATSSFQISLSWVEPELIPSCTRFYKVSAVDGGESQKSIWAQGPSQLTPVTTGYYIYRDEDPASLGLEVFSETTIITDTNGFYYGSFIPNEADRYILIVKCPLSDYWDVEYRYITVSPIGIFWRLPLFYIPYQQLDSFLHNHSNLNVILNGTIIIYSHNKEMCLIIDLLYYQAKIFFYF